MGRREEEGQEDEADVDQERFGRQDGNTLGSGMNQTEQEEEHGRKGEGQEKTRGEEGRSRKEGSGGAGQYGTTVGGRKLGPRRTGYTPLAPRGVVPDSKEVALCSREVFLAKVDNRVSNTKLALILPGGK